MDLRTSHLSGIHHPGSGMESPIEEMLSCMFINFRFMPRVLSEMAVEFPAGSTSPCTLTAKLHKTFLFTTPFG